MELLPPTVSDPKLLQLLGRILAVAPDTEATSALRLTFFKAGFSWQKLVDLAVAHDLLPALVWSLKRRALLLPLPVGRDATGHVTAWLEAAFQEHLARRADLHDQLAAILRRFDAIGIEPILIKGARHLLIDTHGWSQARSMRDLDIVVRHDQIEAGVAALQALGYRFIADTDAPGLHIPSMRLPDRHGAVELHTDALAFNARHVLSPADVERLVERHDVDGHAFRALPHEWHVLHGLLHHQVSERGHARRLLAIKGLWEFAMGAHDIAADGWSALADHMRQRGALDVLSSFVVQAHDLFGLALPPGISASDKARAHAAATLARASWPYGVRRSLFVLDQLRFAFSPEVLRARYGADAPSRSPLGLALGHLSHLARKYRGSVARRLLGQSDRPS